MDFVFPILDYYGGPFLFLIFLALLLLESIFSLRFSTQNKKNRVVQNALLAVTGLTAFRLAVIPGIVISAAWAESVEAGLFNSVEIPMVLEFIFTFLLLDYSLYFWHRLNHKIPFLWRFHNVHHTDLDLDVTTAIRFHFGEILLSIFLRAAVVVLIGASVVNVLIYEVFFQAATAFHHSNLKIPKVIENKLAKLIVTPRMHGIHHSIYKSETDSNYATIFSFWDKLHNTKNLTVSQNKLTIGVPAWRDIHELKFYHLLKMPFKNQREWQLPDGTKPIERDNNTP